MSTTTAKATTPGRSPTRRRRAQQHRREWLVALPFVGPAALGFVVFYLWPTLRGFYFSFTAYDLLSTPQWVGLDNYKKLLTDDVFWTSVRVTVVFVLLTVIIQTIVSLGIATLMHRLTNSVVVRGVILFPFLISGVVVAL